MGGQHHTEPWSNGDQIWLTCVQDGAKWKMSLRRPKPPIKGGSGSEEEEENGNYFENIKHTSFTYIFIWVRKL